MLITDHFIMLNLPKTGSTFARTVIKELYNNRLAKRSLVIRALQRFHLMKRPICEDLILPNIKLKGVYAPPDQHGTYTQIPDEYQGRPIISIVRNPYSRFMSGYEFRWWEKQRLNDALIAEHFPKYPYLTVDDYVRLNELDVIHGRLDGRIPNADVGIQTVQFIQMFFKAPDRVLRNLTDEYLDSIDVLLNDMADITFLRQDKLNEDLADFLANIGYSDEEVDYVRSRERVNVTPKQSPDRNALWTPTSLDYVKRKERMIFRILNAKGITYTEPQV